MMDNTDLKAILLWDMVKELQGKVARFEQLADDVATLAAFIARQTQWPASSFFWEICQRWDKDQKKEDAA